MPPSAQRGGPDSSRWRNGALIELTLKVRERDADGNDELLFAPGD
jgi:hypothetical protein